MRINRCVKCWTNFETDDTYRLNVCPNCETEKELGIFASVFKDSLHTMPNVSRNRLKELDKRVMLPETVKGKDYVCGSIERGKITDKQIDVRP